MPAGETLLTAEDEIKLVEAFRTPPDWLGPVPAEIIHDDTRITAEDYDESHDFGLGTLIHHSDLDIEHLFVKMVGWPRRTVSGR